MTGLQLLQTGLVAGTAATIGAAAGLLRLGRRIRRSKRHLEKIFDHVDAMVVVNRDLRILRANKPFADHCGRSFGALIGHSLPEVAPFLEPVVPLFRECMEQDRAAGPIELPQRDGLVQEAHVFPLVAGPSAQAVLRLRDVTALSSARRDLVDRNEKLGRLTDAFQGEIEMAREIQQALLPTDLPRIEGLHFHVRYQPCRPIGGDLYDISLLDDTHLCIFLADVSGHGLPAAFEAALVRMSLMNHARADASPAEIFEGMNRDLCRSLVLGHYVTAFLGILDLQTLELRYCRASHPRPVVFHDDKTRDILGAKGLFLGIVAQGQYLDDKIRLVPGDRLCLFTDGYYESATVEGRRLGYKEFVARIPASLDVDPGPELQAVEEEFPGMSEEGRDDDRTFLAVDVLSRSADRPAVLRRFPSSANPAIRIFRTAQEAWDLVEGFRDDLERKGWLQRDARRAQLLASELCINAVTHGIKDRPGIRAFCAWVAQADGLLFSVHDEGQGFDSHSLPDPRDPVRLKMDHGRGVFLVRRIAEDLWFDDDGTTATFHLLRTSGET
jgi:serine phosphatase RsbU (regulator of sigma subunit)/anti-sigma regulatory factor (Ser/Thr protein kinase)